MWIIFVGILYVSVCMLIPVGIIVWICKKRNRQNSTRNKPESSETTDHYETVQLPKIPTINYNRAEFEIADGVLKKYLVNALEVQIPECVKSIGRQAFYKNQRIRKVLIPKSVEEILNYAFCGCIMLSDIHFAEGLSVIGENAFYGCTSLQKIEIPQNVRTIENYAFSFCSLQEIHLQCKIRNIAPAFVNAFQQDEPIQIYVPTLSTWLIQDLAVHFYSTCYQFHLYVNGALLESATISENVTKFCFNGCTSLKNVKFESTVEEIGKNAFGGCSISNLYIPQNIVVIGDDAFNNCKNLKEVKIPSAYRARINSIFGSRRDIKFEFYD